MAEALLRQELRGQDEYTVESAGLGAMVGYPAAEHSVTLMDELGLDIREHRARQLHPDMVGAADLVLVMESSHRRSIEEADATARGKVYRLGEWQATEIGDPYRQPMPAYRAALDAIQNGVASWAERIRT